MSTKYSVSASSRWAFEWPRLSEHAADRWDERLPDGAISPERAFRQGVLVPESGLRLLATGGHDEPDGARVWLDQSGEFGAVFPVIEDHEEVIPTVYRLRSVYDAWERAYLRTLAREGQ